MARTQYVVVPSDWSEEDVYRAVRNGSISVYHTQEQARQHVKLESVKALARRIVPEPVERDLSFIEKIKGPEKRPLSDYKREFYENYLGKLNVLKKDYPEFEGQIATGTIPSKRLGNRMVVYAIEMRMKEVETIDL